MSEQILWKYVRKHIGSVGHFSRVESHATAAGFPDVDYCIEGQEGHLELKYSPSPTIPYKCRDTQLAWFRDRVTVGGNCYVLAVFDESPRRVYSAYRGSSVPALWKIRAPRLWLDHAVAVWIDHIEWEALIWLMKNKQW